MLKSRSFLKWTHVVASILATSATTPTPPPPIPLNFTKFSVPVEKFRILVCHHAVK